MCKIYHSITILKEWIEIDFYSRYFFLFYLPYVLDSSFNYQNCCWNSKKKQYSATFTEAYKPSHIETFILFWTSTFFSSCCYCENAFVKNVRKSSSFWCHFSQCFTWCMGISFLTVLCKTPVNIKLYQKQPTRCITREYGQYTTYSINGETNVSRLGRSRITYYI